VTKGFLVAWEKKKTAEQRKVACRKNHTETESCLCAAADYAMIIPKNGRKAGLGAGLFGLNFYDKGADSMRKVCCYECGKRYDFDVDDFCPRCGAFTQPARPSRIGADGEIIYQNGINERNHKNSFLHAEFHEENRERKGSFLEGAKERKPTVSAQPYWKRPSNALKSHNGSSILENVNDLVNELADVFSIYD